MRVPKKKQRRTSRGSRSDSQGTRPFTDRSTATRPVLMCQRGRSIEVRLLQLAQQAGVGDYRQKTQTDPFHQD